MEVIGENFPSLKFLCAHQVVQKVLTDENEKIFEESMPEEVWQFVCDTSKLCYRHYLFCSYIVDRKKPHTKSFEEEMYRSIGKYFDYFRHCVGWCDKEEAVRILGVMQDKIKYCETMLKCNDGRKRRIMKKTKIYFTQCQQEIDKI